MQVARQDEARAEERLNALAGFDILDTPDEEAFDRIARLTSQIFGVEIAVVSMIDGHRQWFKAVQGLPSKEAKLEDSICKHTLALEDVLVIPDASKDERFRDNFFVANEPNVRFYAGAPLVTRDGVPIGTVCAIDKEPRTFTDREKSILRDLAGMVMHELELRQLATVDALTGCLTRRAFKKEGQREVALAVRHRHDLSVLTFDLDHFKTINDTHGHAAGDQVLSLAAVACLKDLRQTDLLGRLGGEEFAVLLPHTSANDARDVAEKLRHSIEKVSEQVGFPVSASFGVASLSAREDIEALLEVADQALYTAKHNGRNQTVSADTTSKVIAQRRRVLKAGKIRFNMHRSSIDCTVRSIGEDGAELQVFSPVGIPENFTLTIPADHFESRCRIASATANQLNVQFAP